MLRVRIVHSERSPEAVHTLRECGVANFRVAPDDVHDLGLADDSATKTCQQEQQVELFWPQNDECAAMVKRSFRHVQYKIAEQYLVHAHPERNAPFSGDAANARCKFSANGLVI
jgi:hypothetical protein